MLKKMLDLFGVEVAESRPRKDRGPISSGQSAPLSPAVARRSSLLWLGREADALARDDGTATLTAPEWLSLRWPDFRLNPDDPPETLRVLASKRGELERAGVAKALTRLFPAPASLAEEIGRLARFYAHSIESAPAPEHVRAESFPSEYVRRQVHRERLKDRARVSEPNGEQCCRTGDKVHEDRRLRAWVSRRNQEVFPRRAVQRRCGKYRHGGRWETLPDGKKKRVRGGGAVELYAHAARFDAGNGRHLDGYRISLAGLVRCGSVWSCLCCAPKINAQRAELLHQIAESHRATGGLLYMLTLTFPHVETWTLGRCRSIKSDAWRLLQQHRAYRRLLKRIGYVGSVRATETTHGVNGWHAHLHVLVALSRFLGDADGDAERATVLAEIRDLWRDCLRACGVPSSMLDTEAFDAHGVVLEVQRDAGYIAKMGLADELTRGDAKRAGNGNRAPFEIMRDYAEYRTADDRKTLREYHRGIKGARQLEWSRGRCDLRKLYPPNAASSAQLALLDGEDDNAAAVEESDALGVHVGDMGGGQWDALARVMHAVGRDAETELRIYAEEFGPLHGPAVLLSHARYLGARVVRKKPQLRKYLDWLDPTRVSGSPVEDSLIAPATSRGQNIGTQRNAARPQGAV